MVDVVSDGELFVLCELGSPLGVCSFEACFENAFYFKNVRIVSVVRVDGGRT